MAITSETLRLAQDYRRELQGITDEQVLSLISSWVDAWDELEPQLTDKFTALAEQYSEVGATSRVVAGDDRVIEAGQQIIGRLEVLTEQASRSVAGELALILVGTTDNQVRQWVSQLPTSMPVDGVLSRFETATEQALDAIVERTTEAIESRLSPIPGDQRLVMNRSLTRGIAEGSNPRVVAQRMVRDTRGAFDGGLARASTIARTEMLDAHRTATRANREANPVALGWLWTATLDARTCMSCLEMHGTEFPADQFGPEDHPNGRCAAVDKVASWRDLGINLDEPDDDLGPNAREWFENLTEDTQRSMMGPTRFQQWQDGTLQWGQFSQRVENDDWRPYYIQTPVRR